MRPRSLWKPAAVAAAGSLFGWREDGRWMDAALGRITCDWRHSALLRATWASAAAEGPLGRGLVALGFFRRRLSFFLGCPLWLCLIHDLRQRTHRLSVSGEKQRNEPRRRQQRPGTYQAGLEPERTGTHPATLSAFGTRGDGARVAELRPRSAAAMAEGR